MNLKDPSQLKPSHPEPAKIVILSPKHANNSETKKFDKKVAFDKVPANQSVQIGFEDSGSMLGKSHENLIEHNHKSIVLQDIDLTARKEEVIHSHHSAGGMGRSLKHLSDDSYEESHMNRSQNSNFEGGNRPSVGTEPAKSLKELQKAKTIKERSWLCFKRSTGFKKKGNIVLMKDQIFMRKTGQKYRNPKTDTGNKLITIIAKQAVRGRDEKIREIFRKALMSKNPEQLKKAEKIYTKKKKDNMRTLRKNLHHFIIKFSVPFLPDTLGMAAWKTIIIISILTSVILSTFAAAFLPNEEINLNHAVIKVNFTSDLIYLVDIILTFHTSFYFRGELRNSSRDIFFNYVTNYNFYCDLISILGLVFLFLGGKTFQGLLLFNIFRMYKLPLLFSSIQDYFQFGRTATSVVQLLKLFLVIIVSAHLFGCLMYSLTYIREDNWVNTNTFGLNKLGLSQIYVASLYWSVTTMATIGYGDITPYNEIERLVTIVVMSISSIIFGYTLSSIGAIIMELSKFSSEAREKMRLVTKYMTEKGLNKDFQVRIQKYLEFYLDKENGTKMEGNEILQFLSDNLKDEIIREVNAKLLDKCDLFYSNFRKKFIYEISKSLNEKSLGPDELIFSHNDDIDKSIYFIANGKVDICYEKCGTSIQKVDSNRSYFGEIAFFSGKPRSASAKTLEFTTLFYLTREKFIEKLQENPIEKETFRMIFDSISIYNSYQYLNILCYSCGSSRHIALHCPSIHPRRDVFSVNSKRKISSVIANYLRNQEEFRSNFVRNPNRKKFNARKEIDSLQEAATRIQLQYEDEIEEGEFHLNNDESMDYSETDEVYERVVFGPPAVNYIDDDGLSKTWYPFEKSKRGTIRFVSNKRDKLKSENEQYIKKNYDYMYRSVSIDKVHNFEVYYPNNNITRLMIDLDRTRVELILNRRLGVKATPISTLLVKGFKMSAQARSRNLDIDTSKSVKRKMSSSTHELLVPGSPHNGLDTPASSKRRNSANPDQISQYASIVKQGSSEISLRNNRKSISASNILMRGSVDMKQGKPHQSLFKPSIGDLDRTDHENSEEKLSASQVASEPDESEVSDLPKSKSSKLLDQKTIGRSTETGNLATEDLNELKRNDDNRYKGFATQMIQNRTDTPHIMFSEKMQKFTSKLEENHKEFREMPDKSTPRTFTFSNQRSRNKRAEELAEVELMAELLKMKHKSERSTGVLRSNSSDDGREARLLIDKWGLKSSIIKKK